MKEPEARTYLFLFKDNGCEVSTLFQLWPVFLEEYYYESTFDPLFVN